MGRTRCVVGYSLLAILLSACRTRAFNDAMPPASRLTNAPWPPAVTSSSTLLSIDKAHTPGELRRMKPGQIAKLSPAEKYDLWNNRFDFTASNSLAHRARQNLFRKAGKGWAFASISEPQPTKTVTVRNSVGQVISFSPDDIKVLVSQIYNDIPDTHNGRPSVTCRALTPVTLHQALNEHIANDRPFIFNRTGHDFSANQPIVGYEIKRQTPRAGGLIDVEVKLLLITAEPLVYRYTLKTDFAGQVVGGAWNEGSDIAGFLVFPQFEMDDSLLESGYPMSYGKLSQLIKQSAVSQATSSDNLSTIPIQSPFDQKCIDGNRP